MHRKYTILLLGLLVLSAPAWAVDERVKEIRDGNRQFDKSRYRKAELEYRRALVKDSTSVDASYNLANTLYQMEDYEQAMKVLQGVSKEADASEYKGDFNYNMGNVCVARKDWGQAVETYKKALLENPGDVDAKENYLYAKAMYDEQQKQQQQNQDQNQDQNQNQDNQNQNNQNQNKDQNKDQNQNQNQDQNKQDRNQQNQDQQDQQSPQNQEQQVSPQAAQQMLQAIQEKEKQTQEKVEKEKAALVGKKKREKNW